MGNVTILMALGIFGFMLLFMFFKLRTEDGEQGHFLLQLLCLGFLLGTFVLIGKIALDDANPCSWNVANSTTAGQLTTYNYNYDCSTNPNATSTTFYKMILWCVRIISLYILIYFIYTLFNYLGFFGGGTRGSKNGA